jgi:hypothetical protein
MLGNLIRYGGVVVVVFLIAFLMEPRTPAEAPEPSQDQYELAVKERQGKGEAIAASVARNSIDPMLVGGDERDLLLEAITMNVKEDTPEMLYLSISDKDGDILAHTEASLVHTPYSPPEGAKPMQDAARLAQTLESPEFGDYYDCGVAISLGGDTKMGEVHLGLRAIPKPEGAGAGAAAPTGPRLGLFIALGVGLVGVAVLSLLSKSPSGQAGPVVDAEKAGQLKKEEAALMKRIAEMRNDEESQRQKLVKVKGEFADLSTQVQAKRQELTQLGVGAAKGTKISEEVNALRDEGAALQRRIQSLKAREASLIQSIKEKREEEQGLETKLDQEKSVIRERAASGEDEGELAQRIESKKREELSLTMRIVSKRREEIAISQRVEAKRREELELMRKVETLKKQMGKTG